MVKPPPQPSAPDCLSLSVPRAPLSFSILPVPKMCSLTSISQNIWFSHRNIPISFWKLSIWCYWSFSLRIVSTKCAAKYRRQCGAEKGQHEEPDLVSLKWSAFNNVWVAPESVLRDEKHEACGHSDLCLQRSVIGQNLFRAEFVCTLWNKCLCGLIALSFCARVHYDL